MCSAVDFHDIVHIRFKPFLGCVEVFYISVRRLLSAKVGRLVARSQRKRVASANAFPVVYNHSDVE